MTTDQDTTDPDQDGPQDTPGGGLSSPRKPARKVTREERLAEELRANLRRRKDQSRLRAASGDAAADCFDAGSDETARASK